MRYPVPGCGKPMGLIAPSRDRSSSPSMEDDDEEVERFSPRYKEYVEPSYFNNDSDDDVFDVYICRDVYDPPDINWEIMKKAQQEREDRKPHGKGRVEMVKFITTNPRSHKRKELSNIGAGASK